MLSSSRTHLRTFFNTPRNGSSRSTLPVFAKSVVATLTEHIVGSGTVARVQPDGVLVRFAYGAKGFLHKNYVTLAEDDVHPEDWFLVGQKVTVLAEKGRDYETTGDLLLSTQWLETVPGDMLRGMANVFAHAESTAQRRLQKSHTLELGFVLDGIVLAVFERSAIVDVGCMGCTAILPCSGLSFEPVEDALDYVEIGMPVTVMVTWVQCSPSTAAKHVLHSRIMVSMACLNSGLPFNTPQSSQAPEAIGRARATFQAKHLAIGQVYTHATIVSVQPTHVVIDVGALMFGTLSANNAGHFDVQHMSEVYHVGETVDVILASIDASKQMLHFKRQHTHGVPICSSSPSCSAGLVQPRKGDLVCGVVVQVKRFGVFVRLSDEYDALIHVSQVSSQRTYLQDLQGMFSVGESVKAIVLAHDASKNTTTLSFKALEQTAGDMVRDKQYVFQHAEAMAAAYREKLASTEVAPADDIWVGI